MALLESILLEAIMQPLSAPCVLRWRVKALVSMFEIATILLLDR